MSTHARNGGFGIDVVGEHVLTFGAAAKHVGKLKGGKAIAFQTLHRWATKGCSGVVLETIFVGGCRCTSVEALQRFFEAVTAARQQTVEVARAWEDRAPIAVPIVEGDVDAVLRNAGISCDGEVQS